MLIIGIFFAFLAVVLGAFGAHALKGKFKEERYVAVWETAVQYQMYHALALIVIGILSYDRMIGLANTIQWAGYMMIVGIVLFSGSLYILAVTGVKKLGAITPMGGIAFLVGWLLLALAIF